LVPYIRIPRKTALYVPAILMILSFSLRAGESRDYRASLEKTKTDLKQVREQINLERQRIQKEKKEEKQTAVYIRKLERELDMTRKELDVFNNNIRVMESDMAEINRRIESTKNEISARKKAVEALLRGHYKKKDMKMASLLMNSRSFSEFITRYKFVKIIGKKNMKVVNEYADALERLEADKQALIEYKNEIEGLKKEKQEQFKRFKNERANKHLYLSKIKSDIEKRKALISELEQSARKLGAFMEQMEARAGLEDAGAESAFRNFAGKFPWPVDGGYVIVKFGKFKHPQFGSMVENRGLHISEKPGVNVYSIFKGDVKYADWFDGFGKMVIIHHGGNYYSIYGHMSKLIVRPGEKVDIRQKIGEVGETESLFGYELYLEIRKKAVPVDPLKYLRRR